MFIGADIGTSSVKLVLVDEDETIVADAEVALAPVQPAPLWSEDDPEAWWAALSYGLDKIVAEVPEAMGGVQAIGLSGQMHSLVVLDEADRPVRPAILWNDGRSRAQAARLAALGRDLQRRTGVLPMAGFTGPKLLWLSQHEPEHFDRARAILLAKDYARLKLSGEKATDVSDAAGTWLLDQARRSWSAEAGAACLCAPDLLPRLVEAPEISARLSPELADRWHMPRGTPIVGGAGDVAAGGLGIGAVEPGDTFISLGTSAQVFIADDAHRPEPERLVHAFCHALPNRWFRMAALLNGASPLAAAARWTGNEDVATLLQEVEAGFRGPSRLLALPYLSGERTPHNDPLARGAVVGLTGATTRADIVQSFCESIAFSLAEGLEIVTHGREVPSRIALIGGGARSAFWARLIASVIGLPLVRYRSAERGPAFGAARLARLGLGGPVEAVVTRPDIADQVEPELSLHEAYRPRVTAFKDLYRTLKPVFPAVAL